MKTFVISLLISTGIFAQWDYHAHFWGSATLTFGLHFKLGKPETFKYPAMVMVLGTLKEISDPFIGGHRSWMDIRADYTGAFLGFMVADTWKRYSKTQKLRQHEQWNNSGDRY